MAKTSSWSLRLQALPDKGLTADEFQSITKVLGMLECNVSGMTADECQSITKT